MKKVINNILAGNKLIAELLGYTYSPNIDESLFGTFIKTFPNGEFREAVKENYFNPKFKIETLLLCQDLIYDMGYELTITSRSVSIKHIGDTVPNYFSICHLDINKDIDGKSDMIYTEIVLFLQWKMN